jgi:hypothetical protein
MTEVFECFLSRGTAAAAMTSACGSLDLIYCRSTGKRPRHIFIPVERTRTTSIVKMGVFALDGKGNQFVQQSDLQRRQYEVIAIVVSDATKCRFKLCQQVQSVVHPVHCCNSFTFYLE